MRLAQDTQRRTPLGMPGAAPAPLAPVAAATTRDSASTAAAVSDGLRGDLTSNPMLAAKFAELESRLNDLEVEP